MSQRFTILMAAATYVGTVVGAGFSSGKEIVAFFSLHGIWGTLGIGVSGLLFILAGTKMMIISARIRAYSFQEFNEYLFGPRFAKVVNMFIFIAIISVTSVLLSGAGALFHEQLGLPFQMGIMITLIFCFIVILKGLNGIMAINTYTVPVMVIFILFLALAVFTQFPDELAKQFTSLQWSGDLSWVISPFTYSAFNIITAQVVLVPLGNEIRNEYILKWAGFWGGIVLFILLLFNHLLLSVFPATFSQEIPMAEIVKYFGGFIHLLFLIVIYAEIFNSVIGNVFGVTRQLSSVFGLRYRYGLFLILFIIFLISQAGYGQLVTIFYPLLGCIGLVGLAVLLIKKSPAKGHLE